jgi:hypothetical protein
MVQNHHDSQQRDACKNASGLGLKCRSQNLSGRRGRRLRVWPIWERPGAQTADCREDPIAGRPRWSRIARAHRDRVTDVSVRSRGESRGERVRPTGYARSFGRIGESCNAAQPANLWLVWRHGARFDHSDSMSRLILVSFKATRSHCDALVRAQPAFPGSRS